MGKDNVSLNWGSEVVFPITEISRKCLIFFQPRTNVKTIFGFWGKQKQQGIWPWTVDG